MAFAPKKSNSLKTKNASRAKRKLSEVLSPSTVKSQDKRTKIDSGQDFLEGRKRYSLKRSRYKFNKSSGNGREETRPYSYSTSERYFSYNMDPDNVEVPEASYPKEYIPYPSPEEFDDFGYPIISNENNETCIKPAWDEVNIPSSVETPWSPSRSIFDPQLLDSNNGIFFNDIANETVPNENHAEHEVEEASEQTFYEPGVEENTNKFPEETSDLNKSYITLEELEKGSSLGQNQKVLQTRGRKKIAGKKVSKQQKKPRKYTFLEDPNIAKIRKRDDCEENANTSHPSKKRQATSSAIRDYSAGKTIPKYCNRPDKNSSTSKSHPSAELTKSVPPNDQNTAQTNFLRLSDEPLQYQFYHIHPDGPFQFRMNLVEQISSNNIPHYITYPVYYNINEERYYVCEPYHHTLQQSEQVTPETLNEFLGLLEQEKPISNEGVEMLETLDLDNVS